MTASKIQAPIRPVAYQRAQAAAALDIGVGAFDDYVRPYIRCIRRGKLLLYPVAELERWADENAEKTLP